MIDMEDVKYGSVIPPANSTEVAEVVVDNSNTLSEEDIKNPELLDPEEYGVGFN